jgi:hypothetical protein
MVIPDPAANFLNKVADKYQNKQVINIINSDSHSYRYTQSIRIIRYLATSYIGHINE